LKAAEPLASRGRGAGARDERVCANERGTARAPACGGNGGPFRPGGRHSPRGPRTGRRPPPLGLGMCRLRQQRCRGSAPAGAYSGRAPAAAPRFRRRRRRQRRQQKARLLLRPRRRRYPAGKPGRTWRAAASPLCPLAASRKFCPAYRPVDGKQFRIRVVHEPPVEAVRGNATSKVEQFRSPPGISR
jgi:hypothetical protein